MTPDTVREKLLRAAVAQVRARGFAATRVDRVCADAGVTKGAFFHHFASKEAFGVAAARYWSDSTGAFFAQASFHDLPDPVDRVFGYLDLRIALLEGPPEAFSCFAGTTLQESFSTSDSLRRACADSILGHARSLEDDLAAAIAARGVEDVDAASLARHTQTVVQGAFILAKACDPEAAAAMAREALSHLRRYFELLFQPPGRASAPVP